MKFNRKVSRYAVDQVLLAPFQKLRGKFDNVYVTFVAHRWEKESDAFQDAGDSFLWLVLPENQPITYEIMKAELLKGLERFQWLDYQQLKHYVEDKLD